MATIQINLGPYPHSYTLDAAEVTRLVAAHRKHMPNGQAATDAEVAAFIANSAMEMWKNVTITTEHAEAQDAIPSPDFSYT